MTATSLFGAWTMRWLADSRGWAVAGLLMLAVIVVFRCYLRGQPTALKRLRLTVLITLRTASTIALALLLLQPVLQLRAHRQTPQRVAVIVDVSPSMRLQDPRTTPTEMWRAVLASGYELPAERADSRLPASPPPATLLPSAAVSRLGLASSLLSHPIYAPWRSLPSDLAVTFYRGDESGIRPVGEFREPAQLLADDYAATGTASPLGKMISATLDRHFGESVAGILLVTDGADTDPAGTEQAVLQANERHVPLSVFVVGTESPPDLSIASLDAPDQVLMGDRATLSINVEVRGTVTGGAHVELRSNGELIDSRPLELPQPDPASSQNASSQNASSQNASSQNASSAVQLTVPFMVQLQEPGIHDFSVVIQAAKTAEISRHNNEWTHSIRALDRPMKILLVEQRARWEFKYLQALLLREKHVQLSCYVVEADQEVTRGAHTPYLPEMPNDRLSLFAYDAVIFGDVDLAACPANLAEVMEQYVTAGGSVIFLAGKNHNPHTYRDTGLARLLPVELHGNAVAMQDAATGLRPQLTAMGQVSPLLRLADATTNQRVWELLPELFWAASVGRAKPAAEVLLVDPRFRLDSRPESRPLLAWQPFGAGETVFLGTDQTWRWRTNIGAELHTRFWAQIVQRFAGRRMLEASGRTRLSGPQGVAPSHRPITLDARLFAEDWQPLTTPSVAATVEGLRLVAGEGPVDEPDSTGTSGSPVVTRQLTMHPVAGQPGYYRGRVSALPPGNYRFRVEHDPATEISFAVRRADVEFRRLRVDLAAASRIAAATGGRVYRAESVREFWQTLDPQPATTTEMIDYQLGSSPATLVLLSCLFGAEWWLRRQSGLR